MLINTRFLLLLYLGYFSCFVLEKGGPESFFSWIWLYSLPYLDKDFYYYILLSAAIPADCKSFIISANIPSKTICSSSDCCSNATACL